LIESFIDTISRTFGVYTISEEELKEDFESAGILNYEISAHRGMLIAIVNKIN
jgi:hypothetical protein